MSLSLPHDAVHGVKYCMGCTCRVRSWGCSSACCMSPEGAVARASRAHLAVLALLMGAANISLTTVFLHTPMCFPLHQHGGWPVDSHKSPTNLRCHVQIRERAGALSLSQRLLYIFAHKCAYECMDFSSECGCAVLWSWMAVCGFPVMSVDVVAVNCVVTVQVMGVYVLDVLCICPTTVMIMCDAVYRW
jgi:hypothetical protein